MYQAWSIPIEKNPLKEKTWQWRNIQSGFSWELAAFSCLSAYPIIILFYETIIYSFCPIQIGRTQNLMRICNVSWKECVSIYKIIVIWPLLGCDHRHEVQNCIPIRWYVSTVNYFTCTLVFFLVVVNVCKNIEET